MLRSASPQEGCRRVAALDCGTDDSAAPMVLTVRCSLPREGDAGTQRDGAPVATAGAWLSRGSRPSLSGSRIYVRLPWNGCACRRRPGVTLMALLQSGGRYPCKNQTI